MTMYSIYAEPGIDEREVSEALDIASVITE